MSNIAIPFSHKDRHEYVVFFVRVKAHFRDLRRNVLYQVSSHFQLDIIAYIVNHLHEIVQGHCRSSMIVTEAVDERVRKWSSLVSYCKYAYLQQIFDLVLDLRYS